jgi:hypothetical protein
LVAVVAVMVNNDSVFTDEHYVHGDNNSNSARQAQ